MQFAGIDNVFGTDAFVAPAAIRVKPRKKLPRVAKGARVLRAPKPPSHIIKNILLTW